MILMGIKRESNKILLDKLNFPLNFIIWTLLDIVGYYLYKYP